jgi:hypothetical protein
MPSLASLSSVSALIAHANRGLRTVLVLMLAFGVLIRPALNQIGELHGLEHAVAASRGHAHAAQPEAGHPHVAAHAHGHGHAHGHHHHHPHDADEVGPVLADHHGKPHVHHLGHDHDPRHEGGHGHAKGSHNLMHLLDCVSSAEVPPATLGLPQVFTIAAVLPPVPWVSTPRGRLSSPFRPPIAA